MILRTSWPVRWPVLYHVRQWVVKWRPVVLLSYVDTEWGSSYVLFQRVNRELEPDQPNSLKLVKFCSLEL